MYVMLPHNSSIDFAIFQQFVAPSHRLYHFSQGLQPNMLRSQGISQLSIELAKYPPAGITGQNFTFESYKFFDRNKEYRIDLENMYGWNLRE
ncbi:MAG: hypothetical protein ABF289_00805 [Clostridiales bacterium]